MADAKMKDTVERGHCRLEDETTATTGLVA